MSATAQKIDPRVKRTRRLLLDAFVSLLAEKSFEAITVQDITTRATVNRATFYAHFVDKYALVDELIREGFAQMLQRRMVTQAGSTQDHMRGLVLAVCDYWMELNGQCKHSYRVFESLVEAQIKAQLRRQVLAELQERNAPRAQPPAPRVARHHRQLGDLRCGVAVESEPWHAASRGLRRRGAPADRGEHHGVRGRRPLMAP
jgi:AcrR family transcriptional regulator